MQCPPVLAGDTTSVPDVWAAWILSAAEGLRVAAVRLNPMIQFYASPAEVASWVRGWVLDHRLHYVFARLFFRNQPPKFEVSLEVLWDEPAAVERSVRDYSMLYLSPGLLDADVPSINHLPLANPDQLCVHLPGFTHRGLTDCAVGSISRVEDSLKVYRLIARDVIARTVEGVWFCQEGRKKVHLDDGMRYSPGAALLHEQAVPLCGGGRMVVGRLGQPRKRARPSAAPGTSERVGE
jgi:hypothetical protein